MNLLAWLLSISFLIAIMVQAVAFQRATVCRQIAWLKSTEVLTRSMLTGAKPHDREWHLGCRLHVMRNQETVTWQRLPSMKKQVFGIHLTGEL